MQADPNNALAWARLAEIHMSFAELDDALEAAQKAVALNPNLSRTQMVLGFAYLTRVDTAESKKAFEKAIELDQADALPRLGLGLAKIREGDLADGRKELEIAASLDPNNSIVRSYLGKAYYEEKRSDLAERDYATAKELDPKDPTPYFYDAIQKQTTNRPVEALQDMQKAIELNDNRAVYRSRLQLDSDLAARSASLGRIYSDLGFQQLALVEGWKSVNTDPNELFRAQVSGRFLLCFAAPRDRQGQRTAAVAAAPAAQYDADSAAPSREQFVPHQRRRSRCVSRSTSSIRCSTAMGLLFRQAALRGENNTYSWRRCPLRHLQEDFLQPWWVPLSDRRVSKKC